MLVKSNSSILSDIYNNSSLKKRKDDGLDPALLELQARDQEVKTHEAAHQAAGGSLAGGASFTYQQGSDGKMYAVGGEVSIDTSKGKTPQETIEKARQIVAAATAPANPSSQDIKVAGSAAMMLAKAQQELAAQKSEESKQNGYKTYSEVSINITAW